MSRECEFLLAAVRRGQKEMTERMQQRVELWSKVCAKYRSMAPAEAGA